MNKIIVSVLILCHLCIYSQVIAQENPDSNEKITLLKQKKEEVVNQEKEALKKEVIAINKSLEEGDITEKEADNLKKNAADNHALNIKNKIAIIDNSIALLERGESDGIGNLEDGQYKLILFDFENEGSIVKLENTNKPKKYDRRTHANFLLSFGLNNAIIDGETINDSPYSIGRSRFFEFGWNWTTRVLNNSNAIRFRYGFTFLLNELSPTDNRYFVKDGELTYLDVHYGELCRSKLRMHQLLFPLHFEFGPSKKKETANYIRYSSKRSFKFGIGAFGGFNLKTCQSLKYKFEGSTSKEKIRSSYNTNNVIYGLSSYIGYGVFSVFARYNLNPLFKEPNLEENNIAFGLRFDL